MKFQNHHREEYCSVTSASLRMEKVSVVFDDRTLLKDIDIEVGANKSLVLVGPSGHGKSTLLRIFAGLQPPTTGKVYIEGQNLYDLPDVDRKKLILKMGMLFQKNALFDSLTVGENVTFPLEEVTDCDSKEILHRRDYFLEAVGLAASRDLFPNEISGGMQKRLGIARALALYPEIVFYDDPTAGLDPITSRKIIDLIKEMQSKKSSTLVAVTNEMARAYQLEGDIAMVVDQEVIVTGNREQTLKHSDPRVHQFVRGAIEGPLLEGP
ncbi:MAG: ATP-binding cassette domain-containing protein [Bdellovibrionales bacterium]|nr:ATP-binding cassette domain-containing protein [Bdellovibrionales bacterium]